MVNHDLMVGLDFLDHLFASIEPSTNSLMICDPKSSCVIPFGGGKPNVQSAFRSATNQWSAQPDPIEAASTKEPQGQGGSKIEVS